MTSSAYTVGLFYWSKVMRLTPPNHTQISNDFIDNWMRKVSPSAALCFIAISRKTVGWHKETDYISISQLMELTGLSNRVVIKAVQELCDLQIVTKERGRSMNKYTISYKETSQSDEKSLREEVEKKQSDEKSQDRVTKSHRQSDEKSHTKETHLNKLNKRNPLVHAHEDESYIVTPSNGEPSGCNISPPPPENRNFMQEFEEVKNHWNSQGLPKERRNLMTCPQVGQVKNNMNLYTLDEMKKAVENYAENRTKINYSYASFVNFMNGSGLHNFNPDALVAPEKDLGYEEERGEEEEKPPWLMTEEDKRAKHIENLRAAALGGGPLAGIAAKMLSMVEEEQSDSA